MLDRGIQKQQTKGMYMFTDNSYKGEAEVVGLLTSSKNVIDFDRHLAPSEG